MIASIEISDANVEDLCAAFGYESGNKQDFIEKCLIRYATINLRDYKCRVVMQLPFADVEDIVL